MPGPDIRIAWVSVHGGVFHCLLRLQERLAERGLRCELLFSAGPPRGLKPGADVPEAMLPELAARGVHFLPRAELFARAARDDARLLVTDAHHDADLPGLIAGARRQGVATAQMATLLGDFTCHGAEHLLLQHPLTLFFELEFNRTAESRRFVEAASIDFTGNIFFEPELNRLHGGFASRGDFFAKYGLDESRPLCLWLPSALDAKSPSYGRVVRTVREAGMNLLAKLHPWEYAFKKHGVDHWGLGRTSDEIWGARAVDEPDASWAYHFCDLAVMRASATCLEMPFWRKPAVLLPSATHPMLFHAQARMVGRCALELASDADLEACLAGPPPAYSDADYRAAQGAVRLDLGADAFAQTVAVLTRILERPDASTPYTPDSLRALYDPRVTPELLATLPFARRLRYRARRLF
jgi:hypothetical protein